MASYQTQGAIGGATSGATAGAIGGPFGSLIGGLGGAAAGFFGAKAPTVTVPWYEHWQYWVLIGGGALLLIVLAKELK